MIENNLTELNEITPNKIVSLKKEIKPNEGQQQQPQQQQQKRKFHEHSEKKKSKKSKKEFSK